MGFDISQFFKPVARLELATGVLFLYPMSGTELVALCAQAATIQTAGKLHVAIAAATSRQEYNRKEFPHPLRLTLEEVVALPLYEIEQISDALLEPKTFNRLWGGTPDSLLGLPAREPGEATHDRISKLVAWAIEEESKRKTATREAIKLSVYGPVQQWIEDAKKKQGVFGQGINELQKSLGAIESGSLSSIKRMLDKDDARHRMMESIGGSASAVDAFNKMKAEVLKSAHEPIFGDSLSELPRFEFDNTVIEHQQLIRKERAKELNDLGLMADASITSARVMNKLSNDVLEFMTKFTEAASTNQLAQTKSVKFALRTFIGGAVLALGAVIFAILSYAQDRTNNESNDKWQARIEILLTLREGLSRGLYELRNENNSIRSQLTNLETSAKKQLQERSNERARLTEKKRNQ